MDCQAQPWRFTSQELSSSASLVSETWRRRLWPDLVTLPHLALRGQQPHPLALARKARTSLQGYVSHRFDRPYKRPVQTPSDHRCQPVTWVGTPDRQLHLHPVLPSHRLIHPCTHSNDPERPSGPERMGHVPLLGHLGTPLFFGPGLREGHCRFPQRGQGMGRAKDLGGRRGCQKSHTLWPEPGDTGGAAEETRGGEGAGPSLGRDSPRLVLGSCPLQPGTWLALPGSVHAVSGLLWQRGLSQQPGKTANAQRKNYNKMRN